jgi:hypothetical protein
MPLDLDILNPMEFSPEQVVIPVEPWVVSVSQLEDAIYLSTYPRCSTHRYLQTAH